MAINDLTDSMEKLIDFLRKSHEVTWVNDLEEQHRRILTAYKKRDLQGIEKSVETVKSYFGGMGSLNDIIICKENKNVPEGLSRIMANKKLDKMLDDLFMWCFFWNKETTIAKKIYIKYLKTYPSELPPRMSRSSKKIEEYKQKFNNF